MSGLELKAREYADSVVDQAENVTVDMLKDYARQDFIAGAEWYKEISKSIEMREMLEKLLPIFRELNVGPVASEIEQLIKSATEL